MITLPIVDLVNAVLIGIVGVSSPLPGPTAASISAVVKEASVVTVVALQGVSWLCYKPSLASPMYISTTLPSSSITMRTRESGPVSS